MRFLHCQLLLPSYFFHLGIHPCTSGAAWDCTPPLPAHLPLKAWFWRSRPSAPRRLSRKAVLLLGTPTWLCTKPGGLGSLHPSSTELGFQLMWKRRRRDKRKAHYSLGGRGFTDDYPAFHWPHICSISSSPAFLSCTYSETLDNCMPAWGLQQGFGLSRCPVFSTQTQNAMHSFIYIFLWEGKNGVYKKNLWRNLLCKPFNNGARGRTLWLSFPLSANSSSQS